MPGLDRTGPQGQGPMTGGARGNCNTANFQNAMPGAGNIGFGRGMGYGRGFRGGYGNGMNRRYAGNAGTPADEINNLKAEVAMLNKRIEELQNSL